MAILFPSDPSIGETFTAVGKTWTWNGSQWEGVPAVVSSGIPSGANADRPGTPSIGDQFYNGTLGLLEIYTDNGWSAVGGTEFNVVLSSVSSKIDLGGTYPAGSYTFSSALNDTSLDIYLFDSLENQVGYSSSPSIQATGSFSIIKVLGGQAGDLLTFNQKLTAVGQTIDADYTMPPYITSSTSLSLAQLDDTITVTGGNFSESVEAYFVGQNGYSQPAKSIVRTSSTQLILTRPDNMINDNDPHTIRLLNPNTTEPAGSSANRIAQVSSGQDPAWISETSLGYILSSDFNSLKTISLSASDESSISYSVVSGALPTGFNLNSSTGEISGTATAAEGLQTFTVRAQDPEGNISEKEFTIFVGDLMAGGAVSSANGYAIHTFTSNGTLTVNSDLPVEYMVVAGGGGGGSDMGGGGGGGGYRAGNFGTLAAGTYAVTVGAGGAGAQDAYNPSSYSVTSGTNSQFNNITSIGGGHGSCGHRTDTVTHLSAAIGGSGGGASGRVSGSWAAGTSGQGNRGGSTGGEWYAGGGGGSNGDGITGQGSTSPDGGPGTLNAINGTSLYWAAGGGGGGYTINAGSGGIGGGGAGAGGPNNGSPGASGLNAGTFPVRAGSSPTYNGSSAGSAGQNTGSGGGGAAHSGGAGGAGGSGIVIVRYAI